MSAEVVRAPDAVESSEKLVSRLRGYDIFQGPQSEALARDDFTNLSVLLRYARDGCWAFALYNSAVTREEVVSALKTLLAPLPVYEWTYSPEAPSPIAYLDKLSPQQRQQRAVVFLFDFERAGDEVWKALDFNRELYSDQPHGLVFWVTPAGRARAARQAPHFWAQRSGVFDFRINLPWQPSDIPWSSRYDISISSFDEIQRQLRLYQGLLDELEDAVDVSPSFMADLQFKVGLLSYYVDRLDSAREHAHSAWLSGQQLNDRALTADALKLLGDLALREDDLKGARERYLAALAIYPQIGARLGEANVQRGLGNLALAEGRPQEAFDHFRNALAIHEEMGDRFSIGGDLGFLARAAAATGNHAQAVLLMEESLTLHRAVGERLGQALNLDGQGDNFWALELQQPALAAWQQARAIAHAIGLGSMAQTLDGVFAQIAQSLGPQQYAQLERDLAAHAEEWRGAGVAAIRQALAQENS